MYTRCSHHHTFECPRNASGFTLNPILSASCILPDGPTFAPREACMGVVVHPQICAHKSRHPKYHSHSQTSAQGPQAAVFHGERHTEGVRSNAHSQRCAHRRACQTPTTCSQRGTWVSRNSCSALVVCVTLEVGYLSSNPSSFIICGLG